MKRFSILKCLFSLAVAIELWAPTVWAQGGQPNPFGPAIMHNGFAPQFGVPVVQPPPESPEVRRLLDDIRTQEAAAIEDVAAIRKLRVFPETDERKRDRAKRQQHLTETVGKAFDLKLQLEEQKVAELKERLQRFNTLIARRKELRERIIANRVNDLIGTNELQWEPTTGEVAQPTPTEEPKEVPARRILEHQGEIQIRFNAPAGMEIQFEGRSGLAVTPCVRSFGVPVGQTERTILSLSNWRNVPAHQFAGLLDVSPIEPKHIRRLADFGNSEIPLELTPHDFERAWKGEVLIKVVYSPNTSDFTKVAAETIVMSDKLPGADPMGDIERNGRILVVLQLAHDGPQVGVTLPVRPTETTKAGPRTSQTDVAEPPNNSPSKPEKLFAELKRLAMRLTEKRKQAEELEVIYFRDHKGVAEFRQALAELSEVRRSWRALMPEVQRYSERLTLESTAAESMLKLLGEKWEQLTANSVKAQDYKEIADAMLETRERFARAKAETAEFESMYLGLVTPDEFQFDERESDGHRTSDSSDRVLDLHPNVAKACVESVTGLRLELVHFDDLNLRYQTALRVIHGRHSLNEGDMIVQLANQPFRSWNEALKYLMPYVETNHDRPSAHVYNSGLSGPESNPVLLVWHRNLFEFLQPDFKRPQSTIYVEMRVRTAENNDVETVYGTGSCVAPEGLFVVSLMRKDLSSIEEILVIGDNTDGGRIRPKPTIVATDENHGLLLVKVEPPGDGLFYWRPCRTTLPARNQVLTGVDSIEPSLRVTQVNRPWPKPFQESDAFVVTDSFTNNVTSLGTFLFSLDKMSMAGIVVAEVDLPKSSKPNPAPVFNPNRDQPDPSLEQEPPKKSGPKYLVIPAVHIQQLLEKYRKSLDETPIRKN